MEPRIKRSGSFAARQGGRIADRRDVLARRPAAPPLNTAEPATSTLAPARATAAAFSGVTPPSTSMSIGRRAGERAHARDLLQRGRDEGLPAEAGVHRHHQDQVDEVDHVLQRLDRRRRD